MIQINVHVDFQGKMAGLLMKYNDGTNQNPNEPQQNYNIMKVNKTTCNEIRNAPSNEFK